MVAHTQVFVFTCGAAPTGNINERQTLLHKLAQATSLSSSWKSAQKSAGRLSDGWQTSMYEADRLGFDYIRYSICYLLNSSRKKMN